MGTRDPRVDAYIEKAAPFARPILIHIRETVHAGCPELEETMKWHAPHFMYKGMLCGMASFKRHCAFGFWKAALLDRPVSPKRARTGESESPKRQGKSGRHGSPFVRIESLSDLPSKKDFIRLVKQAAKLNDEGVKPPKRVASARRAPLAVPADFMAALRQNKKALGTFENFSPSQRREYIEWITEARTDAPRAKRRATAVEWLAEGKGRNWKYMP
jgi:uncharacterized protein YdeI (YjbR/CyaY-like superfamily)